uniref:Membrane protein insertase YidC n=1 Tax=uncultured Actinomycetes bacterium TaxID=152507 RepID=A0A871XYX9_9ACTN|nr:Membrane protein insertase YidC [uncultured Actinomycetes bacterium]
MFDFILNPLEVAVSWVLVQFHSLFTPLFGSGSGVTWALSIIGLVIVIRIALIPLFVKQIKAQRNLQLIQPKMKEIQVKYAGDRERQSQEMMKLYQETGTNPFSSCLPILAQSPIFFALFTVLQGIAQTFPEGVFTWDEYADLLELAHNATLFNVPIYGTFMNADETIAPGNTRILAMSLVVLMTITTFITQRQLIVKNLASDNAMVQQQKVLLYVLPFVFALGGVGFPIGVLLYWLTTNIWSMGQQFWVIRNNPSPGSPAHEAYLARQAAKAAKKGITLETEPSTEESGEANRVQPRRKPRSKRKK